MHIILAHEQADFDAVASQLGTYLLDETLIPVLPQRLNRNVRAFLTIYGSELPFIDRRDLANNKIEDVTLVDTQSMVSLKGMGEHTTVHVIDHHNKRPDLPANWEYTIQAMGATATILVEALRERGTVLSVVQATLLLLGIYEDTGSLTYTRTTPRDLQAAAYLLASGANLQIASTYLNHPLSLTQQALYDDLRATAETHPIHGHTILVSQGDASHLNEELSTIAHKLRDLLDPDGLILLIKIRGGIQLIARSTSDHINVAKIAAHFGGGGHPRAAAALIKKQTLEEVHRQLLAFLPEHIRPATTVAEIMSRGPQLLSPNTPLDAAAQRMQRFGYEGYPVVESGRVIGLLTRRAVDRALAHRLNLPTRSLMNAGEVTIRPGDSIEHLQHVMTDTGWGQIPVVDPKTRQIIGIVTRTDLLKTLATQTQKPSTQNLADRLSRALPPAHLNLLQAIAVIAHAQHSALYIVGGFVRDLLLKRPSLDFDLVVEGDAIALAKALARAHGGRVTSHSRFGTAKWFITEIRETLSQAETPAAGQRSSPPAAPRPAPAYSQPLPETIDFISARTEFYTEPTALPTVARGSIKLDLHRRDFTINTLALRLDGPHYGELHDYWGGLNDLRNGKIRVLHSISFVDDPTRMLRAVRFEQRFGFKIENRTLELLSEARSLLDRVSGDRIRHELNRILTEENAGQMLDRLHELGLLKAIHADLPWNAWTRTQIALPRSAEMDPAWGIETQWKWLPLPLAVAYARWFIQTPVIQVRGIVQRLKLPTKLQDVILAACALWPDLPKLQEARPSVIVARLADLPLLAVYVVRAAASQPRERELLGKYLDEWRHVRATFTGHDLRATKLPPGPIYKKILARLRAAWLDGEVSTPEEEAALCAALLREFEAADT